MSNDQNKRMTLLKDCVEHYCIDLDPDSSDLDPSFFLDPHTDASRIGQVPRFLSVTVRGGDDVEATYGQLHEDFDAAKQRAVEHTQSGVADEFPVAIVDLERDITMRPDWAALTYKLED